MISFSSFICKYEYSFLLSKHTSWCSRYQRIGVAANSIFLLVVQQQLNEPIIHSFIFANKIARESYLLGKEKTVLLTKYVKNTKKTIRLQLPSSNTGSWIQIASAQKWSAGLPCS
uniref:Uncharacterized protein n=1 Tax=Glossina morsitans morsitans TaxID=37546 RepID=A0A1B0FRF7_GLOMM